MKVIKTIAALCVATFISFNISAQAAATPAAKPAATQTKPVAPATTDKVNDKLKGPKGETVYTGSKGGNYYILPSGNKKYLSPDSSSVKRTYSTPAK
jgi:hypothetical protein